MMISKSQIDEVVKAIVENYEPEQVILFGSYASGVAFEAGEVIHIAENLRTFILSKI